MPILLWLAARNGRKSRLDGYILRNSGCKPELSKYIAPMKFIAIVGMPGSGKSVAAEFFRKKGIPVLRFGDETDRGVTAAGKSLTEQNEREWREAIRRELGMAAMAIKIEPRIREAVSRSEIPLHGTESHDKIVLDGLYSWEEYVYLKKKFDQLILLCIWATPAIRYDRLGNRAVRPLTHEDARNRDIAEIEQLNKGGPIAIADYLIENNSDHASFINRLEQFFSSL